MMENILFGDNQFFAVNHVSDEKSRSQSIRFKDDASIIKVLNEAKGIGINTFMCTTHDRVRNICDYIRNNKSDYIDYKIYPCMPYAHKYANSVTEIGIFETIKLYTKGNLLSTFAKGGVAVINRDLSKMMELLIDAEMKMFHGLNTPVIFLQNVLVDLLLGLKMYDVFAEYDHYIRKKYNAEPGYITMNFPKLVEALKSVGIINPIICTSINKLGFRMSGGIELYENTLKNVDAQVIAMQVLAGGAIRPKEAIEYISSLPNIKSILFGASTKSNIEETYNLVTKYL